jgi:hypothetical protein
MSRTRPLMLALAVVALCHGGCAALLDAALREPDDHGHNARHENKRSGAHYLEARVEDDDCSCGHSQCDGGHRTTVIIVHDEEG